MRQASHARMASIFQTVFFYVLFFCFSIYEFEVHFSVPCMGYESKNRKIGYS